LTAFDRKPAGNKLYQGVVKPGQNLGKFMRSRKDPHDIFNLPTSLGGKGMDKSNSKGSLFSKQSKKTMSQRPPKPTFVDLTRGSAN